MIWFPAAMPSPAAMDVRRRLPHPKWRHQGRSEQEADCVGGLLLVYRLRGIPCPDPTAYRLRGNEGLVAAWMAIAGWSRVTGQASEFDCVVFSVDEPDDHLGVLVGGGEFVHVTLGAGLRITSLEERYDQRRRWLDCVSAVYHPKESV